MQCHEINCNPTFTRIVVAGIGGLRRHLVVCSIGAEGRAAAVGARSGSWALGSPPSASLQSRRGLDLRRLGARILRKIYSPPAL
jgi:hypothetical protein